MTKKPGSLQSLAAACISKPDATWRIRPTCVKLHKRVSEVGQQKFAATTTTRTAYLMTVTPDGITIVNQCIKGHNPLPVLCKMLVLSGEQKCTDARLYC